MPAGEPSMTRSITAIGNGQLLEHRHRLDRFCNRFANMFTSVRGDHNLLGSAKNMLWRGTSARLLPP